MPGARCQVSACQRVRCQIPVRRVGRLTINADTLTPDTPTSGQAEASPAPKLIKGIAGFSGALSRAARGVALGLHLTGRD